MTCGGSSSPELTAGSRWLDASMIACILLSWLKLLALNGDLARPEPKTLRIWHIPARLTRHARQRTLAISPDWPWKEAFLTCWRRLCALPAPA